MLIENTIRYKDQYSICINQEGDKLFYSFDYDVRSHDINMEFQHFHPFYELCILLAPRAVHLIEGTRYNIEQFDIVCLRPGILHKTFYPEGDPCKRIIVRFHMPVINDSLLPAFGRVFQIFDAKIPIFRFSRDIRQEIFKPLNEIYVYGKNTTKVSDLQIHLCFIKFLSLIFQHQNNNIYTNNLTGNSIEEKIYAITAYIHNHFAEALSLDFISSHFFISNYYLSHQFKEITGFTLTNYIQMTRIRNVQTLLLTTDIPITEIAIQCGFTSFSQFNRVFRKHVGQSPTEYRSQKI